MTSGSITVAEVPCYNVFLFESDSTLGKLGVIAARNTYTKAPDRMISGSTALYESTKTVHIVSVDLKYDGSETKLTPLAGTAPMRSVGVGSGQGTGFITNLTVTKIYGLL